MLPLVFKTGWPQNWKIRDKLREFEKIVKLSVKSWKIIIDTRKLCSDTEPDGVVVLF